MISACSTLCRVRVKSKVLTPTTELRLLGKKKKQSTPLSDFVVKRTRSKQLGQTYEMVRTKFCSIKSGNSVNTFLTRASTTFLVWSCIICLYFLWKLNFCYCNSTLEYFESLKRVKIRSDKIWYYITTLATRPLSSIRPETTKVWKSICESDRLIIVQWSFKYTGHFKLKTTKDGVASSSKRIITTYSDNGSRSMTTWLYSMSYFEYGCSVYLK